jgi:tRNA-splicing ligase RtcB
MSNATLRTWLATPLETPVKHVLDRLCGADDVVHVAAMPDVHLAADVCVGTAMATRRLVYPGAVGGDIGCGMLAVGFSASADLLADPARAGRILRAIGERIPGRRHHRAAMLPLPDDCREADLSHGQLAAVFRDEGRLQFGTLGGGNHFIELQADEDERLWLMIHSGSRVIGQAVRDHHMARANIRSVGLMALDTDTPDGEAYLRDQDWARRYAVGNRAAMAEQVAMALREVADIGVDPATTIAVDHNHVQAEQHFGETLLVHRKGAMPAEVGQSGVLPGSMGTFSVHVVGRGEPAALRSSAHGAGRQMSRQVARERFGRSDLRNQMQQVWFDPRQSAQLCEEAPKAYKDLRAVLKAQAELVKVTRRLRPLLVYKAR